MMSTFKKEKGWDIEISFVLFTVCQVADKHILDDNSRLELQLKEVCVCASTTFNH